MAKIHILTGPVDSGKTTFLRGVLTGASAPRPRSGYLSLRVLDEEETEGYDLLDLRDDSVRPFLRRDGDPSWPRVGPYYLDPETLSLAEKIILESPQDSLLIVDEVGPLELSESGVWPALAGVLRAGERDIVLVVREELLDTVQSRLNGMPTTIYRENDWPGLRKVLGRDDIAVKVKFFATHKKLFGPGEREVLLPPGSTALDLLHALCNSVERRSEIFDGDDVRPHIVVMINGTNLPAATGTATPLAEGDHVSIFPLLGGG